MSNNFKQIIEDFQQEVKKQQAEFQEACKNKFKELTQMLFDQNPSLKTIIWVGYVPYFNDGDPCNFRVYTSMYLDTDDPKIINAISNPCDIEKNEEYSEVYAYSSYIYGDKKPPEGFNVDSVKIFDNFLCGRSIADTLESVFGSHHIVRITRNSVDVEEYGDHD